MPKKSKQMARSAWRALDKFGWRRKPSSNFVRILDAIKHWHRSAKP